MLIGTTKNCILIGNSELGYQPIVLGHTDELWALASHPNIPQFATAGTDKLLQVWDSLSHSIVWSKDIGVSNSLGSTTKIIKYYGSVCRKMHKVLLSHRMAAL